MNVFQPSRDKINSFIQACLTRFSAKKTVILTEQAYVSQIREIIFYCTHVFSYCCCILFGSTPQEDTISPKMSVARLMCSIAYFHAQITEIVNLCTEQALRRDISVHFRGWCNRNCNKQVNRLLASFFVRLLIKYLIKGCVARSSFLTSGSNEWFVSRPLQSEDIH